MTTVDLDDLDKLPTQVAILRWVKERKAELKLIEDNARGAVEEALGDADTGTLNGKPVIRWSTFKKRQLDQKRLREDHPELVESYTELKETRRFEVIGDE